MAGPRHTRLLLAALVCAVGLALFPFAAPAQAAKCDGKKVTIKGTAGNDHLVGKKASDVIDGGGGNDVITGGPNGNDTICGGPGNDTLVGGRGFDNLHGEGGNDSLQGETGSDNLDGGEGDDNLSGSKGADGLHGGGGDDYITGYKGPDKIDGGAGNDYVDGQQGSDKVDGDGGDDKLLGDKGNDQIDGGAGEDHIEGGPGDETDLNGGGDSDEVFGGAGTDHADGGPGDGDIVRGDAGTDSLFGGDGANDIVSYASATRGGVEVDLGTDKAKGDGHDDLNGFEDVVGSPQADTISGNGQSNRIDGGVGDDTLQSGGGGGQAFGGPGTDSCEGFAVETSCGPETPPPPSLAYGILNLGLDGSSLIIQGSPNNDDIRISRSPSAWVISDTIPIFAGDGCETPPSNANATVCPDSGAVPLIVVTGGNGNDTIVVDNSVPAGAKVRINGNAGDDNLVGGNGDDVLEAGENYNGPDNGRDRLEGGVGSDVLYADPGGDDLLGGAGNDLLVSSVVTCQGHRYDGGSGEDTVSYARSKDNLRVSLGGSGGPPGCGNEDQVLGDNESLEGSDGPDVLVGDNGDNSLMGHLGADVLLGKGGSDFIDAADGQRDKQVDCGGGGDEVVKDGNDPSSSC
ncbi:MAG TPA: calcium-binding protein [Solirubrobacterales bacterium]|nr:calcium-binding protein [Solirubrobacterales bacterium]